MTVAAGANISYIGSDETVISLAQAMKSRALFEELPLLVEGESKIVRQIDNGLVIIRLKPTLFSFSANRTAVVAGTDELRLRISQVLWTELSRAGIEVAVLCAGPDFYISRKVDAPPIEVVVKSAHVGTPKHLYHDMNRYRTRNGGTIQAEMRHEPYVRFDWRNPLPYKDECMPDWLARQFIDVDKASDLALNSFAVLQRFLNARGIDMLDICFFISSDGKSVFGEISPDCMRAKYAQEDLDKDLWRKGKDTETILRRWRAFLEMVER
jgi:phosphoribosylaminoimidazole-succinocarboxamide synthase